MTALFGAILFMAAAAFIAAAVKDARSFLIPNYISLSLLILFFLYAFSSPKPVDWILHAATFVVIGTLGFFAFLMKWIGAGDAKLLAAGSLWAGIGLIDVFLLATVFAGGVEALVILAAAYAKNRKATEKTPLSQTRVPYGVAIAVGGLCVLRVLAEPLLPDRGLS